LPDAAGFFGDVPEPDVFFPAADLDDEGLTPDAAVFRADDDLDNGLPLDAAADVFRDEGFCVVAGSGLMAGRFLPEGAAAGAVSDLVLEVLFCMILTQFPFLTISWVVDSLKPAGRT
jgi:hypothetical protein